MNSVIYKFIHSFVFFLSLTPFWLMYRISDLIYLIMYYIFSYRKVIVFNNLRNSFPEKSEKEITRIAKDFYQYFFDLMLETFKTLTMSKKQAMKRCAFDIESLELLNKLYDDNKDIIIVMGHYGNWEYGGTSFNSYCISASRFIISRCVVFSFSLKCKIIPW